MARTRKTPPKLPEPSNGTVAVVSIRTNCPRCRARPTYLNELVCFPCKQQLDAKPRRRTYERAAAKTDQDYWKLAQIHLYPDRDFYSFTRAEFGRITRLARQMAGIPYIEDRVPPLDEEMRQILDRFRAGEVGFHELRSKIVLSTVPLPSEIDEKEALSSQALAEMDMQTELGLTLKGDNDAEL